MAARQTDKTTDRHSISELWCCENISNYDKSMKLGRMVQNDMTNKFSPVGKMNYAYVGQRSRSKLTIE